ncbi:MAG: hypothetical protein ACREMZ_16735 [Gemmatimonadales bacterium]
MEGLEKRLLMGTAWRLFAQRALVPGILRFARLPDGADALEVGAGGGFAAEVLLARFPRWRLTVTDYDDDMVELARTRLAPFGTGLGWTGRTRAPFPMRIDRSTR